MPSGTSTTRTSGSGTCEPIAARSRLQRLRQCGLGFAVLALASPRTARAADPPDARDKTLPCRPTIACTADFVPPGTLDFEAGALFRRLGAVGGQAGSRQWSFPFLAKLTMAPWVQLQVGSNGYSAARGDVPERFFDDALVGAKVHVRDQTEGTPSFALSASAGIPTFGGQLGYVRTYDASFTGYVTKDVGAVHVDFNVALNVLRVEDAPRSQGLVALALTANMPPPFGVMGEAYYFSNAAPLAPRDGGFLFAFTHSPRPWLVFDVGGDVGWFPSTRSYSAFFGMSVVPAVFWRPAGPAQRPPREQPAQALPRPAPAHTAQSAQSGEAPEPGAAGPSR